MCEKKKAVDLNYIREVKAKHEKEFLEKPDVVGVGIGYRMNEDGEFTDELAIVVSLGPNAKALPNAVGIPSEVEGVPVDMRSTGRVIARK
jgi:hypothetical protein